MMGKLKYWLTGLFLWSLMSAGLAAELTQEQKVAAILPVIMGLLLEDQQPLTFPQTSYAFNLTVPAQQNAVVGSITVTQQAGSNISYSITGNVPFAIDAQGNITLTEAINNNTVSSYSFNITASDGTHTVSVPVSISVAIDSVKIALRSGDASGVTQAEVLAAAITKGETSVQSCATLLQKIYPQGLVSKPDVDIGMLQAIGEKSPGWIPLISAANNGEAVNYALMKTLPNGTRVVVSGMPLFNPTAMKTNFSDGYDKAAILNMLKWLAGSKGQDANGNLVSDAAFLNASVKVATHGGPANWAFTGGTYKLPDWLGANFNPTAGVTFNANGLPSAWTYNSTNTDQASLQLKADHDIFMFGDNGDQPVETILAMAAQGEAKGLFIYVSPNAYGGTHNTLTGTYRAGAWSGDNQLAYSDASSVQAQCGAGADGRMLQLLKDLRDSNFSYTFPTGNFGKDQNDRWKINMGGTQLRDFTDAVDGQRLDWKLLKKLDFLRNYTGYLDSRKTDLFADANDSVETFPKLLLLLGDKFRSAIQYDMDKATTANTAFFKALYADNSVSYLRTSNAYQPDMGSFLSHHRDAVKYADNATLYAKPTTTVSRSFTTTPFDEQTATCVYAPPGKKIKVTRTDSATAVTTQLRFNINHLNTKEFEWDNGYRRPQMMASPGITLAAGEQRELSSPHGGPLYISWNAQEADVKPVVAFSFENVLQQPCLNLDGSETPAQQTQEIADFSDAISASGILSWADIKTPFAEVHTLMGNLHDVLNKTTYNGDVSKYIEYLNKYLILGNYHWAGLNGGGLDPLNAGVASFCTAKGLNCTDPLIHQKPKIQHINSDASARCGDACAGNPIDFSYGVNPLEQLPSHEMGHNLQRSRMTTPQGGEVSNLIHTIRTSRAYALDQGETYYGGWDQIRIKFNDVFAALKTKNTDGSVPGVNAPWANGVAFYAQLMWSSSTDESEVWDFYTKMYLLERLYTDAIADKKNPTSGGVTDDSHWISQRAKLGFGTYSLADAKAINAIDYMAVTASFITGRDYSDFFVMWGMQVSAAAKTQITANAPASVQPRVFYYVTQGLGGSWAWYVNDIIWPVHLPPGPIDFSDPVNAVYADPTEP